MDPLCDCSISEDTIEMNVCSSWQNLLIGPLVYRVQYYSEEGHMEASGTFPL